MFGGDGKDGTGHEQRGLDETWVGQKLGDKRKQVT